MVTSASTSAAVPNTIVVRGDALDQTVSLGAGADVLTLDIGMPYHANDGLLTVTGFTPGEDTLVLDDVFDTATNHADPLVLEDWEDWSDLSFELDWLAREGEFSPFYAHSFPGGAFTITETGAGVQIHRSYSEADPHDDGASTLADYDVTVLLSGVSLADLTEEPEDGPTEGDDLLAVLAGESVDALAGNDTLSAQGAGATLMGGADNDLLHATGAGAVFEGGTGDDVIHALGAGGAALGGAGNDTIHLGRFGGEAFGGEGDDHIEASFKRLGEFTVEGGAGADTFAVLGMGGNAKAATLTIADFDTSEDMLEITTASGAVMAFTLDALPEGVLAAEDEDGNTILTLAGDGHDRIVLTGVTIPEPATLTLSGGDDLFRTPAGAEIIDAGAGNDTILAYRGNHEIRLGAGDDVVFARHSALIEGGAGDDAMHLDMGRNADYALSGGTGADVFNLSGALDTRSASAVIADFTPGTDRLVIEGTEIGPDPLPDDIVLGEDEDGNAVVQFGDDETVTLLGIGRSDLFGSTPNGIVDGTNGADLIDDYYHTFPKWHAV